MTSSRLIHLPPLSRIPPADDQSDEKDAPVNPLKSEPPKSAHKVEMLNEEQMNQQLFGTTWNAQRIIPTPQISYMQSMFTESNTVATNSDQTAGKGTYSSERSQLNNQNNHFSSLAIWAIIVCSLVAALLFTGGSVRKPQYGVPNESQYAHCATSRTVLT